MMRAVLNIYGHQRAACWGVLDDGLGVPRVKHPVGKDDVRRCQGQRCCTLIHSKLLWVVLRLGSDAKQRPAPPGGASERPRLRWEHIGDVVGTDWVYNLSAGKVVPGHCCRLRTGQFRRLHLPGCYSSSIVSQLCNSRRRQPSLLGRWRQCF